MCCIRQSHDLKSHYCCCCIPIFILVIGLTVLTVFDLIAAISMEDWFTTTISSLLLLCFAVSFFKKDGVYRRHLFHAYLIGFMITLGYAIWFCFFSDKV